MKTAIDYAANHLLKVDALLVAAAWVSTLAGAIIYYVWQHPASDKSVRGFFVYSLPKELWSHSSCRLDYVFAVINRIVEPVTIGVVLITTSTVSFGTYHALTAMLGQHAEGKPHILTWITITFVVIMVRDFFVWYSHYLEHKIPMLWQIHACHHSAEFLNPLSNRRHHPLQLVWEGGLSNIMTGITLAVSSYTLHVSILDTALLGVDAYFICDVLSFYQLRHSHIPLHYGKWEKWFLSPSMHQLHHSVEAKDWDKNFGLLTAIWDRVFDTLNIRPADYKYQQGVQPQYRQDYDTISKLYLTPLRNMARIASGKHKSMSLPTHAASAFPHDRLSGEGCAEGVRCGQAIQPSSCDDRCGCGRNPGTPFRAEPAGHRAENHRRPRRVFTGIVGPGHVAALNKEPSRIT